MSAEIGERMLAHTVGDGGARNENQLMKRPDKRKGTENESRRNTETT